MKNSNVKIVEEVNRRKLELIVYAAFFVGFMACAEGRSVANPDNFLEIKRLIEQISKKEELLAQSNKKGE